jgi:hypothetical protein
MTGTIEFLFFTMSLMMVRLISSCGVVISILLSSPSLVLGISVQSYEKELKKRAYLAKKFTN